MTKQTNEGGQILRSLAVLVATLAFIYTIFYGLEKPTPSVASSSDGVSRNEQTVVIQQLSFEDAVEEDEVAEPSVQASVVEDVVQPQEEQPQFIPRNPNEDPDSIALGTVDAEPELQGTVIEQGKTFFSVQDLFADAQVDEEAIVPLSGTFLREGNLRSLVDFQMIGQEEYVLKTVYNSHFAFLGSFDNKSIPGVSALGGNIVEITDKNDIQGHGLYGDRIRFINTERYKTFKKVIYIVFFESSGDTWFVQMDRDRYYATKPLIKDTFDQWYDW